MDCRQILTASWALGKQIDNLELAAAFRRAVLRKPFRRALSFRFHLLSESRLYPNFI